MNTRLRSLFAGSLLAAGAVTAMTGAESAGSGDDRMRAALRDTTLQLRSAQADLAGAQAAQAALVAEKKELAEKYDTLKKQVVADRAAADKKTAGLATQLAELKAQLDRLSAALEKSKAEGAQTAQAQHAAEEQGTKLAAEKLALQRRLTDCEEKNLALFLVGNEILLRYEEFSLGNALRAKEPFVGITRTKLENLVQGYQDKLDNQRLRK
jgi:chromosome segregation ATPase